jgi:hypothetical protein
MVPESPEPELLFKYKLLAFAEFVTDQVVPLLQVVVTVEVATVDPAVPKVLNAILEAVTLHVPVTVPEAVIVPEAVPAKVLFAVEKSNTEQINNELFNLFLIIFKIAYL